MERQRHTTLGVVGIAVMAATLATAQQAPAPGSSAGFPAPGTKYVIEHKDSAGNVRRLPLTVMDESSFDASPSIGSPTARQ
jgi:hypothetical protein